MAILNRQIRLASRPTGFPDDSNFRMTEEELADPGEGQVLVKNHYLSLDPYMRGRMSEAKSYAEPVKVGDVMVGGTVGEVIASRHPKLAVGDRVVGNLGWQEHAISDGRGLQKVDDRIPISAYLGVAGMPGVTAYVGLFDVGEMKEGDTVIVSAAAGAVGSAVGQLAKLRGGRAIGIAGGPAKCEHVVRDLGFDACVDYKASDFKQQLKAATPDGVDVSFENVGGPVMDAVLTRLKTFARVPLCGLVSQYNATEPYAYKNLGVLLTSRAKIHGFVVVDHLARWPQAVKELAGWVAEGKLKYRETIEEGGLAKAPAAFFGMLRGENLGKQLVKL
jgi:NADPH-dependent curcumin reductase